MALVISAGLVLSSASWSGLRCSASRPFPIRLTVVSWPAPNNRMILAVSSSLESLLPSSSGCTHCVARTAPPKLEQLLEIHLGCGIACVGLVDLGARERHRIEQTPAIARTGVEYLAMFCGYPQHVADDRDRQPERKVLDKVHVPLGGDAIQRFIDNLLDARTHVLDPARGEGLHDQAAQSGVVGRVLLQHPVTHAAKH